MTNEQKPESAEFRTREAQIADLAFEISDWKPYDDNEDITLARAHAEEFEARGAAEQRRKDAEGAEPVYQWRLSPDREWVTTPDHAEMMSKANSSPDAETRILYMAPANVAALEARVKELEGALVEIANNKTSDCPQADTRLYQDQVAWAAEWCRRKARAAIREGGE